MALPGDSGRGLSSDCRVWRVAFVSLRLLFFVLLASSVFVCFVVNPTFVAGDLGHEFALSAWGFPLRVSPFYIRSTCVAAIDAPVMIIVVAGWVLLWYSQRPHNALVAFVGEATLWLWNLLPQHFLSRLRGSSCERFGASQWWHWSCPSQLVMALITSIAISHVIVNCCCLLQLCLAPTLTLRLQLRFLLVY